MRESIPGEQEPPDAVGVVLSVNLGLPKDVAWKDRTVHTGIYKRPVAGEHLVRRLNIDGDGQGDLGGHGGEQRAVLVYQEASYEHWCRFLGRDDLTPGSFGENLTVQGISDEEVFIGDRFRVGEAHFEVTQPRVTCFRVGMRLGEPRMASLLVSHGRPGFYLRVIEEGKVQAGDVVYRTRVGRHQLSVARIDALLYLPDRSTEMLRLAVDVPAMSVGWRQSFQDLLAKSDTSGSAPQPGAGPSWQGFRPLVVSGASRETPSVLSLQLSDPTGAALPVPKPGQYLTVRLPLPGGATARSYSISGMPSPSTYRISVKREKNGRASDFLHGSVQAGTELEVAAPRGDFTLSDDDDPVVLISAGIGITPVLAMLASLAAKRSLRSVWWLHAARTAEDDAFAAEAEALLERLPMAQSRIYLSRVISGDPLRSGALAARLTAERLAELNLPLEATAYICGPTAFATTMSQALTQLGFSPGRVRSELFGALSALNPGVLPHDMPRPHVPETGTGADTGTELTFVRSGLSVRWTDEYASILELAEACDVPTRWSCRTGVCHNCVTGLLSGRVEYDPQPLEAPEEGFVLLCCSRPNTDIVLDA